MTRSKPSGAKSLDALNETTQRTESVCRFPADREIPPEVKNLFRMDDRS